jgi:hypothetical protein
MARSWRARPRTLQNLHIQPRRHGAKREDMAHPCNCTFSLYFTMISCFHTLGIMRFAWFSIPACYFYSVFWRARRAMPYRLWVYILLILVLVHITNTSVVVYRHKWMRTPDLRYLPNIKNTYIIRWKYTPTLEARSNNNMLDLPKLQHPDIQENKQPFRHGSVSIDVWRDGVQTTPERHARWSLSQCRGLRAHIWMYLVLDVQKGSHRHVLHMAVGY